MAIQDSAPAGGFPTTIRYKRDLPRRGPSGAVLLIAAGAIMAYGIMKTGADNLERRELAREKTWARINIVPLLEAEHDRDMVRRLQAIKQREEEIMKGDWKGADLKAPIPGLGKLGRDPNAAEPVYHTERYVAPSLLYLPKEQVMTPQWWRGGKVFTKNPPYHNRDDFTKEHPIGQ